MRTITKPYVSVHHLDFGILSKLISRGLKILMKDSKTFTTLYHIYHPIQSSDFVKHQSYDLTEIQLRLLIQILFGFLQILGRNLQ